ncbi:Rab GTPase-binding exocyst subunit S15 [Coemansia thaxteri]|uniref:Rab GTPase-binding exocyst subunit S15 n=1 Tax=Coemansia thaxteri TaxID=2663907 RepID=A0A9W8BHV5_9FUNG|nr:Rab GTPase-binding exocyst subunit S15 [Coemansia thaxteri]KAJ2005450.1 Rab GTPase-binding exocyst subunit S15 [Coemansia thaxteri]KAJ2469361.1 Rab GTPase-binding exocyst subunit S15 [Coemansia sp. RSA 2322]KAJ2484328.1 Rab GTPase-binding exocyst subunit S15 [Coemansia sp. RSA 2320]
MADSIQQQLQQLVLLSDTVGSATAAAAAGSVSTVEEAMEQLGPLIHSVYRANKQALFRQQVDLFAQRKDAEIMKLCGNYHQEFVQSVAQLLKVRQNTSELQEKVVGLNVELQLSGKSLYEKKAELLSLRREHRRIHDAAEAVRGCLDVVRLVAAFDEQVATKQYYSAIKTLGLLKDQSLPAVRRFAFGNMLDSSLPQMGSRLQAAALRDMKDWLFGLKTTTRDLGRHLSARMLRKQAMWADRDAAVKERYFVSSAVQFVLDEEYDQDPPLTLDMMPLYQCLHINEKLGRRAEFRRSFSEDRSDQLSLALASPLQFSLADQLHHPFDAMLCDVIGFFVVEHAILASAPDFRSKTDVDSLWDAGIAKLSDILARNIQAIRTDSAISQPLHSSLTTFSYVMEENAYDVRKLRELIMAIFGA